MSKTLVCLLALTAATAAPAAAESRSVPIADLDLSSAAGQERMERRITSAARAVCGADHGARHHALFDAAVRDCISAAKARAMAQVARRGESAIRGG